MPVRRTAASQVPAAPRARNRPAQGAIAAFARSTPQRGYSEEEYNLLRQRFAPNQPQADGPLSADRQAMLAKQIHNFMDDRSMWPVVEDVIHGNASAVEHALDTGRLSTDATFFMNYPFNNLHSLLDVAVASGQRDVVKVLLDHHANVNTREVYAPNEKSFPVESPLTEAARNGEDDVVRLLLEEGADIDQLSGFGPGQDSDTALDAAVYSGDVSTAYLLLTHGADLNTALGPGETVPPVLLQPADNSPRVVALRDLLIEYGAKMPSG